MHESPLGASQVVKVSLRYGRASQYTKYPKRLSKNIFLSGMQLAEVDANRCDILVLAGHAIFPPRPGQKKLVLPSLDCRQSKHSVDLLFAWNVPGRQKQSAIPLAPFSEVLYTGHTLQLGISPAPSPVPME
jgi:hypothetical protein